MLKILGAIELPPNKQPGGFDHASVHKSMHRLFVAHTANDSIDVIDTVTDSYLETIPGLTGIAGVLVSDKDNLVFTSNRGENTVGFFSTFDPSKITKISVDLRPNGIAYDSTDHLLLVGHVGDPVVPGSYTVALLDLQKEQKLLSIPVPGRTRWAVFDQKAEVFYINIANPPQIFVIDPRNLDRDIRKIAVPGEGPHGLDINFETRRLYCACDGKQLLSLNPDSGQVQYQAELIGTPDVIFLNKNLGNLYVAIGDPGIIEVYSANTLAYKGRIPTEPGAHTIGFDAISNKVYAFLPQTHRAIVFIDQE
jgi:DNA-binding beta-propeller fold protein YncE